MNNNHFVAVIGLGALGASALRHLSRSGKRVLALIGLHLHTRGSIHGESRITRIAVEKGMAFRRSDS